MMVITNLNSQVQKLSQDLDRLHAALQRILGSSGPRPYQHKLAELLNHLLVQASVLMQNANTTKDFIEKLFSQKNGELKIESILQRREVDKIKRSIQDFAVTVVQKMQGIKA